MEAYGEKRAARFGGAAGGLLGWQCVCASADTINESDSQKEKQRTQREKDSHPTRCKPVAFNPLLSTFY